MQVVAETQDYTGPLRHTTRQEDSYPAGPGDEAFTPAAVVRPLYRELVDGLRSIGISGLTDRMDERDRWLSGAGMTFRVGD